MSFTEGYTKPATNIRRYKEYNIAGMALQESSSVSITGGTITGTELAPSSQAITEAGAIDLDAGYIAITGPGASTYAVTLAAPTNGGVTKVIEMVATTATNSVTLALTNVVGGSLTTTATFDAAGETLVLVSNGSKWVVLKEFGVTLS